MSLLRSLLVGAVDYAGLFPPAELSLPAAVQHYRAYQASSHAWALGRFILPVAQLPALEPLLEERGLPFPISAVVRGDAAAARAEVEGFNRRWGARGVRVEAVEIAPGSGTDGPERVARYVEVPWTADPEPQLRGLVAAPGFAKVRTGGVTDDAIPPAEALADWILAAARLRLPFKATAGLHHAVRGRYPLTYAAGSPSASMHGFLNLMLASALIWQGAERGRAIAVLELDDPARLEVTADRLSWAGYALEEPHARELRRSFLHSFGSCSFREPIDELTALGVL